MPVTSVQHPILAQLSAILWKEGLTLRGPCGSPSRPVYGRLLYGDGMFRVAPFFRAASATLALKAVAWLRRLGLICLSSSNDSTADNTLIPPVRNQGPLLSSFFIPEDFRWSFKQVRDYGRFPFSFETQIIEMHLRM